MDASLTSEALGVAEPAGPFHLVSRDDLEMLEERNDQDPVAAQSLADPGTPVLPQNDVLGLPDFGKPGETQPAENALKLPDFAQYPSLQQLRQLARPALEFVRQANRFGHLRNEVLLFRNSRTYLKNSESFKATHLLESSRALLDLISAGGTQENCLADSRVLGECQLKVVKDHDAFQAGASIIQAREGELATKEFELQRKEYALAKAAQELSDVIKDLGSLEGFATFPPADTDSQASSRSASPALPAALVEYQDRLGVLGYLRERVINMDSEYREEIVRRDLREDQELFEDVPKDLFDANYRMERVNALKAVEDAKVALRIAREACLQEQINVEADESFCAYNEHSGAALTEDYQSLKSDRYASPGMLPKSFTSNSSLSELPAQLGDVSSDINASKLKTRKQRRSKKHISANMRIEQWILGSEEKVLSSTEPTLHRSLSDLRESQHERRDLASRG